MRESFGRAIPGTNEPLYVDRGPRVMTTLDMDLEEVSRRYDHGSRTARRQLEEVAQPGSAWASASPEQRANAQRNQQRFLADASAYEQQLEAMSVGGDEDNPDDDE
jgi:hypothetical protein